ncbi:MAG: CBS domain-containing protein [Chloroflexi bacterium]|nr:MAG: CBS domain-containing protein [Chloroflexota bacterium]
MRVRDLPPQALIAVDPDTSLAEVARRMRLHDTDSVAVMAEGRLLGIITERNLVGAIADGVDPEQVSADVVMTAGPATIAADEDVTMVAVKMVALGVRHLTVVDEERRPIGLLSARNLVVVLDRSAASAE